MSTLLFVLLLVAITFLVLGLIKPRWAWAKTRKQVATIFTSLSVILLFGFGVSVNNDNEAGKSLSKHDDISKEKPVDLRDDPRHLSLGLGRSEITELLKPIGFEFEKSPDNDGRANYIGQFGMTIVQLFGSEDDLSEIQFLIGTADNQDAAKHQAGTIMAVLNTVIPEWQFSDIGTWVGQAVEDSGGEFTQYGKHVTFTVHDDIGMASIVVTAVPKKN